MQYPRPLATLLLAIACAGALMACRSDEAPALPAGPPVVQDVAPREVPNDRDTLLILTGSGFRPGVRVAVGPKLVGRDIGGRVTWVNEAVVTAAVARGLEPGVYDVGVTNLDGRFAKLDLVLTVRRGAGPAVSPSPAASPTATPSPSPTPAPSTTPSPTPAPSTSPSPSPAPTPPPPPPTREPPALPATRAPAPAPTPPAGTATPTPRGGRLPDTPPRGHPGGPGSGRSTGRR